MRLWSKGRGFKSHEIKSFSVQLNDNSSDLMDASSDSSSEMYLACVIAIVASIFRVYFNKGIPNDFDLVLCQNRIEPNVGVSRANLFFC